ncbi:MAG: hypothetical protein H5T63_03195 [Chloroflexi bacterium]|nr:hypothetical protein [Chloroflexota bacterium]
MSSFQIRFRQSSGARAAAFFLLPLFLPMLSLLHFDEWLNRNLPADVASIVRVAAIVWAVLGVFPLGLLWRRLVEPRGTFHLRLDGSLLTLSRKTDNTVVARFDLARPHCLFITLCELLNRESNFLEQWAEVRIAQEGTRLTLIAPIRFADLDGEKRGNVLEDLSATLQSALRIRSARNYWHWLWWQCASALWADNFVRLPFLQALDEYREMNMLMPRIVSAQQGDVPYSEVLRAWRSCK